MKQLSVELFKDCCALNFSVQRWSNRKTVKVSQEEADRDKVNAKRLRKTVRLTTSKQYDRIVQFQNETKAWVQSRSMPSFFKVGIFMVKLNEYDSINSRITQDQQTLKSVMVPDLCADIKSIEYLDRQELGPYYSPGDYPEANIMEVKFGFTWLPVSFGVPENLPKELYLAAKKKSEQIWLDAQEKILVTLRMSFSKLIDHAVERLTVAPGEKAKTFKSSTIENIREFLETFNARNIMNDKDLAELVKKAESVMSDVDDPKAFSEMMRGDDGMRERMASQFSDLKGEIDKMITIRPSRQFINDDIESD